MSIADYSFVCRESYEVASKVYTKAFGTAVAFPSTWFHFEEDILYLNIDTFSEVIDSPHGASIFLDGLKHLPAEDLRRVRHLAIYLENSRQALDAYELWLSLALVKFGSIKKLTIIAKHSKHSDWEKGLDVGQMSTLDFVAPIDVLKVISQYVQAEPVSEAPTEAPINRACVSIDMDLIESFRQNDVRDGTGTWDMPIIEQSVVLSTVMKTKLEKPKRKYHRQTGSMSYFDWPETPSKPRALQRRIKYETKLPRWWYKDDWEIYVDDSRANYQLRDDSIRAFV